MHLNLTADEVLKTTRSVRKRLDFDKPVERSIVEECLEIALQAPTGGNRQGWHFIVIEDAAKTPAAPGSEARKIGDYFASRLRASDLARIGRAAEFAQELALALTFALEKGWLTIALALMSFGTAWVSLRRPIAFLRTLAAILRPGSDAAAPDVAELLSEPGAVELLHERRARMVRVATTREGS